MISNDPCQLLWKTNDETIPALWFVLANSLPSYSQLEMSPAQTLEVAWWGFWDPWEEHLTLYIFTKSCHFSQRHFFFCKFFFCFVLADGILSICWQKLPVIKCHALGTYSTEMCCITALETQHPNSRCSHGLTELRSDLSLWPVDGLCLCVIFPLCGSLCPNSPSCEDTSHWIRAHLSDFTLTWLAL